MTRRITTNDIRAYEAVVNNRLARMNAPTRISIEWAYGQPRAYLTPANGPYVQLRELSARMSKAEMHGWLDGFDAALTMSEDAN